MFKSKRVRELEEQVLEKERQIVDYKYALELKDIKIEKIQHLINDAPEGCKYGPWCKACEFLKTFYVMERPGRYSAYSHTEIRVCGKAEVCDNFVVNHNYKEITE